jgi:hypothetical protein
MLDHWLVGLRSISMTIKGFHEGAVTLGVASRTLRLGEV